jgi:chromosome partitioning protein
MSIVIAIANQKGGVGKTTTNVNLAGFMSRAGYSVLVIDADPQCNSTSYFIDPNTLNDEETIAAIYNGPIDDTTPTRLIRPTRLPRLDVLPGGFSLSARVVEIVQDTSSGLKIAEFIKMIDQKKKYDLVFIDCPPDIGIFTMGAFYAADYVLIPIQPERMPVDGVEQLMEKIQHFWDLRNEQKPRILGMITNMFHGQNKSNIEWAAKIKELCGDNLLGLVHRSANISTAADARMLIQENRGNQTSRPFREYLNISKKIITRLNLPSTSPSKDGREKW